MSLAPPPSEAAKGAKPVARWPAPRIARHAILLIALLCLADGLLLEPYALVVTRHDATGGKGAKVKIAHLSDLHTKGQGRLELAVLEVLEREKPDVIVISGDTVDAVESYVPAATVLAQMHAPLGVYMVNGNWENWRPAKDGRGYVAASKAKLLLNESVELRPGLWLAGFDDASSGTPSIQRAMRNVPADSFVIGLFHSPDFFERLPDRIRLAFAGHTHGGQVRLPFLGALWRPPGSGRYDNGWYTHDHARMYVSRGIGTSILPVRFRCAPELAIVTLYPETL